MDGGGMTSEHSNGTQSSFLGTVRLLRARKISPVELVEQALAEIERLDPLITRAKFPDSNRLM